MDCQKGCRDQVGGEGSLPSLKKIRKGGKNLTKKKCIRNQKTQSLEGTKGNSLWRKGGCRERPSKGNKYLHLSSAGFTRFVAGEEYPSEKYKPAEKGGEGIKALREKGGEIPF